jgi:hypothetical protein
MYVLSVTCLILLSARRRTRDSPAYPSWPYSRRFLVELSIRPVTTFDRTRT